VKIITMCHRERPKEYLSQFRIIFLDIAHITQHIHYKGKDYPVHSVKVGRDSVVRIAPHYGLGGPGIKFP
jgi:hypothetical protein